MAHYALLNENNIVTSVFVGINESNTEELPEGFTDWESWYAYFYGQTCKRTSYNTYQNQHISEGTPFRGNFAGKGMLYDVENDVFLRQVPFDSWVLNTSNWTFEAPVEKPVLTNEQIAAGNYYQWNEETTGWDLIE